MKEIIRYQSNDESIWKTAEEAEKRDLLLSKIAESEGKLNPKPTEDGPENYVQQDLHKVMEFKQRLLDLAAEEIPSYKKHFNHPVSEVHPPGMAARIICDNGGPLNGAWYRICCIDRNGREYLQAYYANQAGY